MPLMAEFNIILRHLNSSTFRPYKKFTNYATEFTQFQLWIYDPTHLGSSRAELEVV